MVMKMSAKELSRAKHFQSLGIPLDEEVLEASQDAYRGLSIGQDRICLNTNLFDLASGGTGVLIGLGVCNQSDRVIRIGAVRVDIPWCEQIRWLKVPLRRACAEFYSSLPMSDFPSFGREQVLNHSLKPNSKIFPGACLDGFLLGIGEEPIPDQYWDRQLFETQLSIYTGRNNAYHQDLKFLVSRGLKNRQRREALKETLAARLTQRRSFFSDPDAPESSFEELGTPSRTTNGQIMVRNENVGMLVRPDFTAENNSEAGNTKEKFSRDAGDASTNLPPVKVERDDESVTNSASGPGSESSKGRASRSSLKHLVSA